MQDDMNFGCTEEFAELCALSTSGTLSVDDEERIEAHIAVCAQCALLLNQYRFLATTGMARIAAMWAESENPGESLQDSGRVKSKLLSVLAPLQARRANASMQGRASSIFSRWDAWRLPAVAALAAMLLVVVAARSFIGGFQSFRQTRTVLAQSAGNQVLLRSQIAQVQSNLASTKLQLVAAMQSSDGLQVRCARAEQEAKDLRASKEILDARIAAVMADAQRQRSTVDSLTAERDQYAQRLRETEFSLQAVRQELKAAQDERQRVLLRAANLEAQVDRLLVQVRERDDFARHSEEYLASDRDVRELMGARQLHIADVFDIDAQGKTKAPFGRVFYTKGRSLIFYGFDLDQQPGYREAKAFQAWGRLQSGHLAPVNLGVFYLDNETNRRWALKFNDPKVLEEINAVFVTVEPTGGSKRPTNKPFLLTYLHTTSLNHP